MHALTSLAQVLQHVLAACLVHCVAGINRSGFIVGGLCMLRGQRPVLEVLAELKRVRGTVLLNQAFQLQLLNVARDHGLLGDLRSPNRADRAERVRGPAARGAAGLRGLTRGVRGREPAAPRPGLHAPRAAPVPPTPQQPAPLEQSGGRKSGSD